MNKENAKYYLPLVQALAEGKLIQHRGVNGWYSVAAPSFDSPPSDYRIKPGPREVWVNHYPTYANVAFCTKEAASDNLNPFLGGVTRHYREVIE